MSREVFQWLGLVVLAIALMVASYWLFKAAIEKHGVLDADLTFPAVILGFIGIAVLIGAWEWSGDLFFESQYPEPQLEVATDGNTSR